MSILKLKNPDGTWSEIPALVGKKGEKGDTGPAPIKGVDYFTEEERAKIVEDVKSDLTAYIPAVLTSDFYGDELPEPGTPGRIFFKKVNE